MAEFAIDQTAYIDVGGVDLYGTFTCPQYSQKCRSDCFTV
jgi:hypothetical protein